MMRTANRTHPGSIAELCQRPATPPQMTESLCDALVRILIWALGVSLLGTVIASIIRRRGLRQARIVAIVLDVLATIFLAALVRLSISCG
jgi:hypothetical protein